MDALIDFLVGLARWALRDHLDGTVVAGAVLAAWLFHRAEMRGLRRYDAWWFLNIPGAASRLMRR